MRVFKGKSFAKFARNEGIADQVLCQVARDANTGKIDADYGGGVIKQRIARRHEGKSGGYRSIILFRKGARAFFVYGFAKNDMGNIGKHEETLFKKLAKETLTLSDDDIAKLLGNGVYTEVLCDDQKNGL